MSSERITIDQMHADLIVGGHGQAGDVIVEDESGHPRVRLTGERGAVLVSDPGSVHTVELTSKGVAVVGAHSHVHVSNGTVNVYDESELGVTISALHGGEVIFGRRGEPDPAKTSALNASALWLRSNGGERTMRLTPDVLELQGGVTSVQRDGFFTDGMVVANGGIQTRGSVAAGSYRADAGAIVRAFPYEGPAPSEGDVVVMNASGRITVCRRRLAHGVIGVCTSNASIQMGDAGVPVAIFGWARCKVRGRVGVGDLLVSSDSDGYAEVIASTDLTPGTVIGKALEPSDGESVIAIIVSLQ